MKLHHTHTQEQAALKSGMNRKTARRYLKQAKMPSEFKKPRSFRTRKDPFEAVWPACEAMLESAPGLEAKTLLEWLMRQEKKADSFDFHQGQLRTLQRRVRAWHAQFGADKEVIFPQTLLPGRQSQSDCTWMNELEITVAGEIFRHLLFHFMLPYSRWETVSICQSESLASLTAGYSAAVWELGALAPEHRTDNLTAATQQLGNSREFTKRWSEFLRYHGVQPSRNNPGVSHENGSVEKSHDLLKRAIRQQLLVRGSRDFATLEEYQAFLKQVVAYRNSARQARLQEELPLLLSLPVRRWETVETLSVRVSSASTIRVQGAVYSVPARLINYSLSVDVYPERLVLRYGQQTLETLPRCVNKKEGLINYRHVIGYLLRKPGAFAHYQYRDALFPQPVFRKAYDALLAQSPARGAKSYLQLLQLATVNTEQEVALSLELLLNEGKHPSPEHVNELLTAARTRAPDVVVLKPSLAQYDDLLNFPLDEQGAPHGSH